VQDGGLERVEQRLKGLVEASRSGLPLQVLEREVHHGVHFVCSLVQCGGGIFRARQRVLQSGEGRIGLTTEVIPGFRHDYRMIMSVRGPVRCKFLFGSFLLRIWITRPQWLWATMVLAIGYNLKQ
jgi:hypothetical protein